MDLKGGDMRSTAFQEISIQNNHLTIKTGMRHVGMVHMYIYIYDVDDSAGNVGTSIPLASAASITHRIAR